MQTDEYRAVMAILQGPWPRFGGRLRALRLAHAERGSGCTPSPLCAENCEAMCVSSVCLRLDAFGCPLSEEEYLAIERGETLPRPPLPFLEAFAAALELDDEESQVLLACLLFDIACGALTPAVAIETFAYLIEEGPSEEL